jgi:hypothetical protein
MRKIEERRIQKRKKGYTISLKTLDIRSKSPCGIKLTAYGHDEVRVFVEDLTTVNGVSYISNATILAVKLLRIPLEKIRKNQKI